MQSLLLRILPLLLLPLAACTSPEQGYAGDERPSSEVATLSISYDAQGRTITVGSINGMATELEARSVVRILPGRCALAGRARGFGQPSVGAPYAIEFLARAGGNYVLLLDQPHHSERLLVSVEDMDTKEVLAELDYWP
ncbi:MAG: hypothetical protein ACI8QS_001297 [Planctomycetota bacterium]|jgi:hypothetical protein